MRKNLTRCSHRLPVWALHSVSQSRLKNNVADENHPSVYCDQAIQPFHLMPLIVFCFLALARGPFSWLYWVKWKPILRDLFPSYCKAMAEKENRFSAICVGHPIFNDSTVKKTVVGDCLNHFQGNPLCSFCEKTHRTMRLRQKL